MDIVNESTPAEINELGILKEEDKIKIQDFNTDSLVSKNDNEMSVKAMVKMKDILLSNDDSGLKKEAVFQYNVYSRINPKIVFNSKNNLFYSVDFNYWKSLPTVGFKTRGDAYQGWKLWTSFNRLVLLFPNEDVDIKLQEPDEVLYF